MRLTISWSRPQAGVGPPILSRHLLGAAGKPLEQDIVGPMTESGNFIDDLFAAAAKSLHATGRVKSFHEFLKDVQGEPYRSSRSAAEYLLDMMGYFGEETIQGIGGSTTRYLLFDAKPYDGKDRVHGQEEVQEAIYRALRSFVVTGQSNRLILLHGPNGSAKSSIVNAMVRGLEYYSQQPEGVIHRFHWIFPKKNYLGTEVGFHREGVRPDRASGTFAFLDMEDIAARVPCELRDHPLLILPRALRAELLERARAQSSLQESGSPWILEAELCSKCRAIMDSLLAVYRGDLKRLLAHVQVERYFISKRYRCGAVTINPQVTADAEARQVTMDRSLSELPPYLQTLSLFQLSGDLVDGNGGLLEFSDILKRSIEANKYLLTACETGFVPLGSVSAQLNVVMMGSTNERHLQLFRKSPDYSSFKGRFKLIPTPYLLKASDEAKVYADQLAPMKVLKHLAPHTIDLAAYFAVMTRLRRPDPSSHAEEIRDATRSLNPLEKAKLYDAWEVPSLSPAVRKALSRSVMALRDEFRDSPHYEGRFGASPREMRDLLLGCFYDEAYECVTPPLLFEQLSRMISETSVYEFLSIESDNGYHDADGFIGLVREEFLDRVNEEVRESLELVAEDEYSRLFVRYVMNVKAFIKGEKVQVESSSRPIDPEEHVMERVESVIAPEGDRADFRRSIMGRIGAYSVEHSTEEIDYAMVFPELIDMLKDDFFFRRREAVEELARRFLQVGSDEFELLDEAVREKTSAALDRLIEKHGYCGNCAKEVVAFLLQERYA